MAERQVKSKQRVADHGEVFTAAREVNAMLDLVKPETERVDSRFLEPACGEGAFLTEILRRKLAAVKSRYGKSPCDYERYAVAAVASIYGVDILADNVQVCRKKLFAIWDGEYTARMKSEASDACRAAVRSILRKNILCGDALAELLRGREEQMGLDVFRMKFDVIVSNPPYHLNDGGNGKSARPVYHHFVSQAKKLRPRYMVMVIPSRWFTGGKGLDGFRKEMLSDRHIRKLVDYENFKDLFPGVDLAGGACYFLWDRDSAGPCEVINFSDKDQPPAFRYLNEHEVFIRQNPAVSIVNRIISTAKAFLSNRVSSRKPFGLPTNYQPRSEGVPCWFIQRIGLKYADRGDIDDTKGYLEKWKLLAPKAPIAGQTDFSRPVMFYYDGNTRIAKPGECCTESYIVLGAFDTPDETLSYKSYIFTKVVRFLLLQTVVSQDVTRKNFCFIPDLGHYAGEYTDEMLCKKWNISENEWKYIASRICGAGGDDRAER